jgi:hypothetical protein
MTRQKSSSTGKSRAAQLASKFSACEVHRREARAFHRALEQLAKRPILDVSPEDTLADLLPPAVLQARVSPGVKGPRELATLAHVLSTREIITQALDDFALALELPLADRIRTSLLGPAASSSTWQTHTLGARSVRGLVNERVRWRGGCQCSG